MFGFDALLLALGDEAVLQVASHRAGDIDARCGLDSFEAGTRIDFQDQWAISGFEHINARDVHAEDVGGAESDCNLRLGEVNTLDVTTEVEVRAEFIAGRAPAHRRADAAADDEDANVMSVRFLDVLLHQRGQHAARPSGQARAGVSR